MKDLSIIIVTYNSEDFIKNCLSSLFENVLDLDFEVIIVDNNSKDKTLDLIRENFGSKVKIIENQENVGFARGINQGIKIAEGEIILFLNPDTLIPPYSIKRLVEFLKERKEAGIVGCRTEDKIGQLKPSFGYFPRLFREFFWALGMRKVFGRTIYPHFWNKKKFFLNQEVDWISGACFMTKKEVIEKIGLLDENFFMYFEDIDFCWRARKAGYKTFYLGEVMINHMLGRSEKERAFLEIQSLLVYFKKHLPRQIFLLMILITIRKILLKIKSIFI